MMMADFQLIFLVVCAYVMRTPAFPNRYGVVKPGDPFKFVGETLTLFCNITDPTLRENSSHLYFEKTSKKGDTNVTTVTIPMRNIQRLTSKSIRLDIPRLTLEDDGNYVCLQRKISKETRYIGHQIVKVDYRPKQVEAIDCVIYNWQSMTCNWTLGVPYKYPENINVTLVWTTDEFQLSCPDLSNTSCTWPPDKYSHVHSYIMKIVVKTVQGRKTLAEAFSPQFEVDTELFVKPAPIKDFQAMEENSTCIGLSWGHSSPRKKHFIGKYSKQGTDQWIEIPMDKRATTALSASEQVCNLTPFTSYTFNISVLPYPEDSDSMATRGFRSDWISVSAKTRENVPGASPSICPSCYYIQRCAHNTLDCQIVHIYWKEVPFALRHGSLTGYSIRLVTSEGAVLSEHSVSKDHHSETVPVNDDWYDVQLRASTSEGLSHIPSVLNIPSKSAKRPSPPKNFRVQIDVSQTSESKYYLNWTYLSSNVFKYSGITIVWCQKGMLHYECQDNINWVTLDPDKVTYELIPGDNIKSPGQINIGIATEAFDGNNIISSGIEWSHCRYIMNQKPKKKPQNVRWSPTQPNKGLTVLWDRLDCTEEQVYVTKYRVSLCPTRDGFNCSGRITRSHVKQKTEETFLKLDAKTKYLVRVQAISDAGYGPQSLPINMTVVARGSPVIDDAYIVTIGVISIVLLLLIIFIIWFIRRCLMDRRRKMEGEFPIDQAPSYAEAVRDKQPLNRCNSRFQDRPLPEVPTAAQHYYGLNACMVSFLYCNAGGFKF